MKKTLAILLVLASVSSAFALENENGNFELTWAVYENYCFSRGIEPLYENYEKLMIERENGDGHCDFIAMEILGLEPDLEIHKLFNSEVNQ